MPRFAANLTTMFNELPFLDRFAAAAAAGFGAVECIHPYAFPPEELAARLSDHNLIQILFNLPAGDWEAGERGIGVYPHRFDEFKAGLDQAMPFVKAMKVRGVHLMAGIADAADREARTAYANAIAYAADLLAGHGVEVMLEPISPRNMLPGYFMTDTDLALEIIAGPAAPM